MHGLLKVAHLLPQLVILRVILQKLLIHVLALLRLNVQLRLQVQVLVVHVLLDLLNPIDLHFALVDLNLVLFHLQLRLVVDFLLGISHNVQLLAHVLDLFGLRRVDVRLARDVLVALLDLQLRILVPLVQFPLRVLRLRQLDLDVAERILELLVLDLAETQHLAVLDLGTLLALDSQSLTRHALNT